MPFLFFCRSRLRDFRHSLRKQHRVFLNPFQVWFSCYSGQTKGPHSPPFSKPFFPVLNGALSEAHPFCLDWLCCQIGLNISPDFFAFFQSCTTFVPVGHTPLSSRTLLPPPTFFSRFKELLLDPYYHARGSPSISDYPTSSIPPCLFCPLTLCRVDRFYDDLPFNHVGILFFLSCPFPLVPQVWSTTCSQGQFTINLLFFFSDCFPFPLFPVSFLGFPFFPSGPQPFL